MSGTGTGGAGWLALAVAALSAPAVARGAHPLVTDDAGTLGRRGARQLELTSELSRVRTRAAGARVREDSGEGAVTVGVGLLERLDVAIGFATTWSQVTIDGERAEHVLGLGDVGLELKWQAFAAGGFALALKPGVTVPTGDAAKGLGTGRACYGLTAITSQELGPVALHANVGYHHDEYARADDRAASRANLWRLSAAATGEIASGLRLVGDVGAETNPDRASTTWPAYALGGFIYSPREDLDLDAGVKVGLTAPEPDLAGRMGVTWRF
jgi:hypothetical protein